MAVGPSLCPILLVSCHAALAAVCTNAGLKFNKEFKFGRG
jgi:hypothetical protein